MAKRCFELSTTVPGPPDAAVDFLMDLEKHRRLHPFLVSARISGTGSSHLRALTQAVATEQGETRLTENVAATAPFLLVGYLARQARYAHTRTYARLPAALAEEALSGGA